jgi:hypothetical protein
MTTLIPEEQTEKTPATTKQKAGVTKRRAHVAPPKAKPGRKTDGFAVRKMRAIMLRLDRA